MDSRCPTSGPMATFDILSQELVSNIIEDLIRVVSELAYVLELRLTCSRFNETIILHLFTKGSFWLFPMHQYYWGPCVPYKAAAGVLRYAVSPNPFNPTWVKRQYLQTRIASPTTLGKGYDSIYPHLAQAAHTLQNILKDDTCLECEMQKTLILSSCEDLATDRDELAVSLVVESAICCISGQTIFRDGWYQKLNNNDLIHSNYWLANVACWSGSMTLMSRLESGAYGSTSTGPNVEAFTAKCLPTAIRRGHQNIIEYVWHRESQRGVAHRMAVESLLHACLYAGDSKTLNRILGHNNKQPTNRQMLKAALEAAREFRNPQDYLACARHLFPSITLPSRLDQSTWGLLTGLTVGIAHFGDLALIDLLWKHGLLNPYDNPRYTFVSALDSPSRQGNLAMVKKLFELGYFNRTREDAIDKAISQAAEIALRENHWCVFEELMKHFNGELAESEWLVRLAAADGALPVLKDLTDRVEGRCSPLSAKFRPLPEDWRLAVGPAALEQAVQALKPVNAEYLLNLGIRLLDGHEVVSVGWCYARQHKADLEAMQELLVKYHLPLLQVSV